LPAAPRSSRRCSGKGSRSPGGTHRGRGVVAASALLLAPIHRSAWKGKSPKYAWPRSDSLTLVGASLPPGLCVSRRRGAMRELPVASPSRPAAKHTSLASESPVWARQRPPVWGMRPGPSRATIWSDSSRARHFSPLQGTAARPSLCPYSPECVEGLFSELRLEGVLGSRVRLARSNHLCAYDVLRATDGVNLARVGSCASAPVTR